MGNRGTGRDGNPAGFQWRALSQAEKLGALLNHYVTVDNLSEATGIAERSLRAVFSALQQGKNSPRLDSWDYRQGFRAARHRMTDHLRRREQAASAGKYVAPLARIGATTIAPETTQFEITQYARDGIEKTYSVESFWISYYVEHLKESEIFAAARQLFEVFRDTGQFNAFRFEYIADADDYMRNSEVMGRTNRRSFKDKSLAREAMFNDVIRISSQVIALPEMVGNPDAFEDEFRDMWDSIKRKGGQRIVALYWTKFAHMENAMRQSREDFRAAKQRTMKRGNQKGNRKRGK